jgi:hypothetical protein
MIVTRDDYYIKAMGIGINDLFTAEVAGTNPTIETSRLVGPEPPIGHPAHLTKTQIRLYSPDKYHEFSWPWMGYNRVPRDHHRLPTVMHAYGTSEKFWHSHKGIHGFVRRTSLGGYRFYLPRELLVAQGFPRETTLPENIFEAWELLGNAIPPPLAAAGLGPMAFLAQWDSHPLQEVTTATLGNWMGQILTNLCARSRGHKSDHWNNETRQQHWGSHASWKPRFHWQLTGHPEPQQAGGTAAKKN